MFTIVLGFWVCKYLAQSTVFASHAAIKFEMSLCHCACCRYTFNDTDLLRLAFIHPSVGQINNARLAWLGDAVLEMVVSHNAYTKLLYDEPGRLHNPRQSLVDTTACVKNADKLNLRQYFVVGKSFKPDDLHPTPHMVADLFEAVLAAVYVDAGYNIDAAQHLYDSHFA